MTIPEVREGSLEGLPALTQGVRDIASRLNQLIRAFNTNLTASIAWSRITGTPTTRSGYGITDAAALSHRHNASEIDGLPASVGSGGGATAIRYADLLEKPTTVDGFGLTDASRVGHTHPFGEIHSRPSTLGGYGINDASPLGHTHDDRYYTESEVDSRFAAIDGDAPFVGKNRAVLNKDHVLLADHNYLLLGPVSTGSGVTIDIPVGAVLVTM